MKKIIALIMALAVVFSVIAIAEQTNTEAAVSEAPAATAAPVITATPAPTATATPEPIATPVPHVHAWSADGRICTGCGEAYACWNAEEMTFVHDFTDSETCLVCEAALYCGVEGHEKTEAHMIGACGIPGHFVCDEKNHAEVYGNGLDYDAHTMCLEQVQHHCDGCGADYSCEFSNSHVPCLKCEKLWCDKSEGNHTTAACGHRYCEIYGKSYKHSYCAGCHKFLCNGRSHSACTKQEEAV